MLCVSLLLTKTSVSDFYICMNNSKMTISWKCLIAACSSWLVFFYEDLKLYQGDIVSAS